LFVINTAAENDGQQKNGGNSRHDTA